MQILLPPAEAKSPGGDGPPVDLLSLAYPELRAQRRRVIEELAALSGDVASARAALKVSSRQDDQIVANTRLRQAATMPALRRYSGVLYQSLDPASMTAAEASRAGSRCLITSALFGVVRARDHIPEYRLSAGSVLPAIGPIARFWRPLLDPLLSAEPVLDLRSSAYTAFAPAAHGIRVVVKSPRPDGSFATVSHFNKSAKGRLARAVAAARREAEDIDDVLALGTAAGLAMQHAGNDVIHIITDSTGR